LGCKRFRGLTLNYSLLLLEEETGVLYVGARGALYALQASDISSSSPLTVRTHKTHQHIITELASQNCIDIPEISYFYSSSPLKYSVINSLKLIKMQTAFKHYVNHFIVAIYFWFLQTLYFSRSVEI